VRSAASYGTQGQILPDAVAVDPASGDVVVAGHFHGELAFGGVSVSSQPGALFDGFVARLDRSGAARWVRTYHGEVSLLFPERLAIRSSGEVVISGTLTGAVDLGAGPLAATGEADLFLLALDAAGAHVWSKAFGAPRKIEHATGMAVDASGNILLTGDAAPGLDLGGGPLSGIYAAKLDARGGHVWSRSFAQLRDLRTTVPSLAVEAGGGVLVAGNFTGSIDLAGEVLTTSPAGATDGFLVALDPDGGYRWSRHYGGPAGRATVNVVGAAPGGEAYVAGVFDGTVDFGGGPVAPPGAGGLFLTRATAAGAAWTKVFGVATAFMTSPAMTVDGAGRPALAFDLRGSIDLGAGPLASDVSAVTVAAFDADGAYRWGVVAGPGSARSTCALTAPLASGCGAIVLVGGVKGASQSIGIGEKSVTATAGDDMFVASIGE
jgi:hypothetical protein